MVAGKLEGKVALVTGGTSGIGAATVRRLTADGAKVIFTGSKQEKAQPLCDETGAAFESHRVQDEAGWTRLVDRIRSEFGRLDIAFANAGMETGDGDIEHIKVEDWNNIIAVNQTGVMLTIQKAISIMRDNPGGSGGSIIVNSSMNGKLAMGNYITYSVTKAAVLAIAKSAALHCAKQGTKIRVNSVLPGVVETEMILNIMNSQPDPEVARGMYEGMAPLNRMAQTDEIAALVAFLASDEAAFITGADYSIDGGATAGTMGV